MNLNQTIATYQEASLRVRDSTTADSSLAEQLLKSGTEEIETLLRRKIVSRGTITEYHTFRRGTCELWLNQFPVITVTSIHEDPDRDYGASTLLTVDEDYIVETDSGLIRRVDDDSEIAWETGLETVKIVYTAGYTQATVPLDLKEVALELFEMQWGEVTTGSARVASATDGLGARTYFGPAELTSHMKARIGRHERALFRTGTYSRSTVV